MAKLEDPWLKRQAEMRALKLAGKYYYSKHESEENKQKDYMRAKLYDIKDSWIDDQVAKAPDPSTKEHGWHQDEFGCNKCKICLRVVLVNYKVNFLTDFNWEECGLPGEEYWQGKHCLQKLSDEQYKKLMRFGCGQQCRCTPCWNEFLKTKK